MRTLVGSKCAEHARFAYVVKNGARVCCAGSTTEALCDDCRREVVTAQATMRPKRTELPPVARTHQDAESRVYGRGPAERRAEVVPPPPSLTDRILAHRARAGRSVRELLGERLRGQMAARHRRELAGR